MSATSFAAEGSLERRCSPGIAPPASCLRCMPDSLAARRACLMHIENRWGGRRYTDIVQADRFGMHTAQDHLAAVKALGLAGRAPDPDITVGRDARLAAKRLLQEAQIEGDRPFVCLHPGARWWFKAWPGERFAALADRIQTMAQ